MKNLLFIFILFTAFGYSQSIESTNTSRVPELKMKAQVGFSILNNLGLFTSVDYFFNQKTFIGIGIHSSGLASQISTPGIDLGLIGLEDVYTSYMLTVGMLRTNPNNPDKHVNLKLGIGLVHYDKVIDYESSGGGFFSSYDEIREDGNTFGLTLDLSYQKIGKGLGFMIGPYVNLNLERPYVSFKVGLILPLRK